MKRLFILLTVLLFSCNNKSPAYTYENSGLSFMCPEGWNISEEEEFEGGAFYLSVEKKGFDSSGIITITRFDDHIDLEELSIIMEEELSSNIIYEHSNLNIQDSYWGKFAGYDAYVVQFNSSILGVNHTGFIYSFYSDNNTFSVFKQEADEDTIKNLKGFELIENSFRDI